MCRQGRHKASPYLDWWDVRTEGRHKANPYLDWRVIEGRSDGRGNPCGCQVIDRESEWTRETPYTEGRHTAIPYVVAIVCVMR